MGGWLTIKRGFRITAWIQSQGYLGFLRFSSSGEMSLLCERETWLVGLLAPKTAVRILDLTTLAVPGSPSFSLWTITHFHFVCHLATWSCKRIHIEWQQHLPIIARPSLVSGVSYFLSQVNQVSYDEYLPRIMQNAFVNWSGENRLRNMGAYHCEFSRDFWSNLTPWNGVTQCWAYP